MTNGITTQWKGIAASPGYAIARAFVINKERYVPLRLNVNHPAEEQARFILSVRKAVDELDVIRLYTLEKLGPAKAQIFEGHLLLLRDPELVDVIVENIGREHMNAEFALYEVAQMFIETFMGLDDELLRARAIDIRDVSDRVMNVLRGVPQTDLATLLEECVIIAEDLTPSDTASLNVQVVKGIISEIGSRTSHSAIMARTLGIPAIVGVGAMNIASDSYVIIDAIEGIVIVNPNEEQRIEYQAKLLQYERKVAELRKLKDLPTITVDGHQVELAANIGKLEDIEKVLDNGAEAIGLFRTEFLYMDRNGFPSEDEQFEVYKHVLEKMDNKPVVIRTFDIGGDKELSYMELPKESNPFLGLRALRLCFKHEQLFRIQLRALLRASVHGNLKIMFPMIAVLEEWHKAKEILSEEKVKLLEQGVAVSEQLEIGMMVEVPASALAADTFASEVDFFSIGTNDLIQYTMAADRMNESVSYLYQPCHPSILKLVNMVVEAAHKQGKWVGMCGEMAGDAMAIPLLIGLGLHELSMSASSILPSRQLINNLQYKKLIPVASHAMTLRSQHEVLQYASDHIENKG